MKPGIVIREKRLIPVTSKANSKIEKMLGKIDRSTLRDEVLICAMVSPDGKTGVFLDDTGREYLIKEKDLSEKLVYITSKYVKKETQRYVRAKQNISQYENLVKDFITKSDTPKRYTDWLVPEGFEDSEVEIDGQGEVSNVTEEVTETEMNEAVSDFEKAYKEAYKIIGTEQLSNITKKELDGKALVKEVEWAIERLQMDLDDILDPDDEPKAVKDILTAQRLCKQWLKKWKSLNEEELNEEQKYQKGKTYISKDGKFKFKVLSSKGGEIQILDLSTNLKCKVEVSDLELVNPRIDEDTTSADIPAKKETIEEETLDESKVLKTNVEIGDDVIYKGKKYNLTDIEGSNYYLQPEDKRKKELIVKEPILDKVDEEVNEEFNPFKDMEKLPDSTNMKPGLFTDGEGGVYEAPKSGLSKKFKSKGFEFAYDFKTRELVVFNKNKEVERKGLSISSWLDNPKYWADKYAESLDED